MQVAFKERTDVYCDACGQLSDFKIVAATFDFQDGTDHCWGGSGRSCFKAENDLQDKYPEEFSDMLDYIADKEVILCEVCNTENYENYVTKFGDRLRATRGRLLARLIKENKIPELSDDRVDRENQIAEYEHQRKSLINSLVSGDNSHFVVARTVEEIVLLQNQIQSLSDT